MPTTIAKVTVRCQFCLTWNRVDPSRAGDRPKCGKCAKPILLDRPWILTEETFKRTVDESEIPVLVDFYADWCGPCKVMAPFVDQLAANYQGKILVGKLDTDRAQQISSGFTIRGIPTVIIFVKGKELSRQTGAVPLAELQRLADQALSGS